MPSHRICSLCSKKTFILLLIYLIVSCCMLVAYLVYWQGNLNYLTKTAVKKGIFSRILDMASNNQSSFEWIRKKITLNIPTTVSPPREGYININYYPYIINEANKCKNSSPFLVLIIATVASEFEKRNAIRQSWGNESLRTGIPIVRIFMLGKDNTIHQNIILQESEKYHDIIQKNFHDSYKNLTIKTMMGIEWVSSYCSGAKYVMKTDSDMFINTNNLLDYLGPNLPTKQNFFTGCLLLNQQPHRNPDSKWHMPYSLYPSDLYPDFCSGTGYVFSGDLAPKILRASFLIKYVYLEDVFVGICLEKENVRITPPLNNFLFNNYKVQFSPCAYNRLITSHEISPAELVDFWKIVQENKAVCNNR